jgi:uncharacterized membrane protein required for colicin V production
MLFDGLVIVVVALAAGFGARKGFARLAAGVIAPIVGVAAGWPLSAEILPLNRWLAFALLYVMVTLVVFGAAALARRRLECSKLEAWDSHLGLILGAAQGCALVLALTLVALSVSGDLRETVASTRTGGLMVQVIRELRPMLPQGASDFLDPWFSLLQRRNA